MEEALSNFSIEKRKNKMCKLMQCMLAVNMYGRLYTQQFFPSIYDDKDIFTVSI